MLFGALLVVIAVALMVSCLNGVSVQTGGPGGSGQSAACESEDMEAGVFASAAAGEDGDDRETTITVIKKVQRKGEERERGECTESGPTGEGCQVKESLQNNSMEQTKIYS